MFTGIIHHLGQLQTMKQTEKGLISWLIRPEPAFHQSLLLGESIAVSGVCLTVAKIEGSCFWVDLSPETLKRTTFQKKDPGCQLNLERSLRVGDRLGGHFVMGHVDGVGVIKKLKTKKDCVEAVISLPFPSQGHIAPKGSIAVEGVSLTINSVPKHSKEKAEIELMWIPFTLEHTTLKDLHEKSPVNIEFDVMARYIWEGFQVYGKSKKKS